MENEKTDLLRIILAATFSLDSSVNIYCTFYTISYYIYYIFNFYIEKK